MIKQPKGIEFHREFEPDMQKMVKALKVVLESPSAEPLSKAEGDSNKTVDQNIPSSA